MKNYLEILVAIALLTAASTVTAQLPEEDPLREVLQAGNTVCVPAEAIPLVCAHADVDVEGVYIYGDDCVTGSLQPIPDLDILAQRVRCYHGWANGWGSHVAALNAGIVTLDGDVVGFPLADQCTLNIGNDFCNVHDSSPSGLYAPWSRYTPCGTVEVETVSYLTAPATDYAYCA